MSEKFNIEIPSFETFSILEGHAPTVAGVYVMLRFNTVVYIGQSTNLKVRLANHEFRRNNTIDEVRYLEVDNDIDRLFFEMSYHYLFLKKKIKFHGVRIRV